MTFNLKSENSIDESIKLQFEGLIKSLSVLSSDSLKQIELMGDCIVTDEMALDFDAFYLPELYIEAELLDESLIARLNLINQIFDQQSSNQNSSFWNVEILGTNQDWQLIRILAKEILDSLELKN